MSHKDDVYRYINSLRKKPYYGLFIKTADDLVTNGTLSSDPSHINFLKCLKELKRNLENKFFDTPKRITYNFSASMGEFQLIDSDEYWYGALVCWGDNETEARIFVKKII